MKRFLKGIQWTMYYVFFLLPWLIFILFQNSYASNRATDLTELTLEELMNIEITSVSRKPEKLSDAASAVYVITQEEILRSGLTSIPEMLRMVPGLNVASITGNKWAISARGFNKYDSNFLLVFVDGINVYSPTFGGANWDEIDTVLEDIERIEVIRGPGATMWGADAVNGVINIITKNAKNTQGGLVTVGGGNYEEGFSTIRYGGTLGDNASYRTYVKYFNRDSFKDPPGKNISDRWDIGRSGFRIDWDINEVDSLTLQGDIYRGDERETLTTSSPSPPYLKTFNDTLEISGGNILTRWSRKFSDTSDMKFQLYYYRAIRDYALTRDDLGRFDMDLQHRFAVGRRHDIVWGLRYNYEDHDLRDSFVAQFDPERRQLNLFSGFFQDEIVLIENQLHMIVGTKIEYNHYTDFEIQPSGRLLYKPHENHTLWAAISRAVKTPNRLNRDSQINIALLPLGPILTNLISYPNHDFDSEEVISYELGYRSKLTQDLSIDIAGFYTEYHDVFDYSADDPFFEFNPQPHLIIPFSQENKRFGHTYGTEILLKWKVLKEWNLVVGYTWLKLQIDSHLSSALDSRAERSSPENQFQIRSYIDLPWDIELDSALYYVDHIGYYDIPSYIRFDTRLGWNPTKNMNVSIVLQNLLDDHHPEFNSTTGGIGGNNSEIERSFYIKIMWKF